MAKMVVKDAMTENFVRLGPSATSSEAAKAMADADADCIIVMKEGTPAGIVTASDFLRRIVAEGKKASEIHLKKIMSSPVITIDTEDTISRALLAFSTHGVKRLVVLEGEEVVGIITSVDLLSYTDEIKEEEEELEEEVLGPSMCEICEGYFEVLSEVDGKFVCEDCKEMLEK